MMVSESATVSGFILPGNHRSSTYAITYDAVYNLKSARLFAGSDSVVGGEVRARMSELRKTGIGGFPRRQKVLVPCRGRLDVASQLAGHRHAVQREARAAARRAPLCKPPLRRSNPKQP